MTSENNLEIEIALGDFESSFVLEDAICNHGFFMMAPNKWDSSTKTFQRPLRLSSETSSLNICISQQSKSHLRILVLGTNLLSQEDQQAIKNQVCRMLRISTRDEKDVREFQKLNARAAEKGFGRLFRAPTLFEDLAKAILLCNSGWGRTLRMARHLCQLQAKLENGTITLAKNDKITLTRRRRRRRRGVKRKCPITRDKVDKHKEEEEEEEHFGNFPSAEELAYLDVNVLNEHCNLGNRAETIIELATRVVSGKLNLQDLEEPLHLTSYQKAYKELMKVHGIGSFVCANVMMCIGNYEVVPADSETVRHVREKHHMPNCTKDTIQKVVDTIYEKFAPYQSLAYWMELCDYYEEKIGKLSTLPRMSYPAISGSIINKEKGHAQIQ